MLSENDRCSIKMSTDYDNVKCLFPAGTKIINFNGSPHKYTALLRCRCKSKEEFRENWLRLYEKLSRVTLRVLLTRPKTGKTVVYKAAFRCEHNTYPGSHQRVKVPHKKHTGCPAILKVTIKASPENRCVRSMDTLRKEYPTIISIIHEHNHVLPDKINIFNTCYDNTCAETLKKLFEIGSETFTNVLKDSDDKKQEMKKPNWNYLKKCWSSFMEKCESSNSVHLYGALLKATNCLKNCRTVSATISALNSIGQSLNQQSCDADGLVQRKAIMLKKYPCNEVNKNSAKFSNAVDSKAFF